MNDPKADHLRTVERNLTVAIKSLRKALVDASDLAHEIAELDPPKDDEEADYDRLMSLGTITEGVGALCTPKLRVLVAVPSELIEVAEPGERGEKRETAH
jgi:hypothetical protein